MQHSTCPHCGAPLERSQPTCPSCGREPGATGSSTRARDNLRRQASPWVIGGGVLLLFLMVCMLAYGFRWVSGSASLAGDPQTTSNAATPAVRGAGIEGAPAPVTRMPTRTPAPTRAVRPTHTAIASVQRPRPTLADGGLFYDAFDDPDSGWDVLQDPHGEIAYRDGRYLITVQTSYTLRWGNAHTPDLADFVVSADAQHLDGPPDSAHGLIIRYVDSKNFYSFNVSGLGEYRFGKYEDDQWTSLVAWTPSDTINIGEVNTLAVRCEKDTFALYINGVELGAVRDGSFARGDIALSAQSDDSFVRVAFDNVNVRALE